jgi:flagellar hook assembly protein FlgD
MRCGNITRISARGVTSISEDNGATWRLVSLPHNPVNLDANGQSKVAALRALAKQAQPGDNSSMTLNLYPDPFASETEISYINPSDGGVAVTAYDALGKKVADIVNGSQSAGVHTAQFRAGNLPNGVYYIRCYARGVQTVMPVLLAR